MSISNTGGDEDGEDAEEPAEAPAVSRPSAPSATTATPPCEGVLTVTVHGCANLVAADRNGLSDPFIELCLGDHSHTTAVRQKTLHPVFGETVQWQLPAALSAEARLLKLDVYDEDVVSNDFLGGLDLDLAAVLGEGSDWRNRRVRCTKPLVDRNGVLAKDKSVAKQIASRTAQGEASVLGKVSLSIGFEDPACINFDKGDIV